jgi:hypothetical protein
VTVVLDSGGVGRLAGVSFGVGVRQNPLRGKEVGQVQMRMIIIYSETGIPFDSPNFYVSMVVFLRRCFGFGWPAGFGSIYRTFRAESEIATLTDYCNFFA